MRVLMKSQHLSAAPWMADRHGTGKLISHHTGMPVPQRTAESVVQLTTTVAVCFSLLTGFRWLPVISLLLCSALAFAADASLGGAGLPGYVARAAESSGSGLGMLALPWLFGALLATAGGAGGHVCAFHSAMASAALQLCFLCCRTWCYATSGRRCNNDSCSDNWRMALGFAAGGLAVAVPLLALPPADAAAALGTALLSCVAFHGTMKHLPRTFTAGEGMLVSQATALLASYVARILLGCNILGAAFKQWTCGAASPFQAFAACLVLGTSALTATIAALVARPPWSVLEASKQAQAHSVETKEAAAGGANSSQRGSNAQHGMHQRSGPSAEAHAAACPAGRNAGPGKLAAWRVAAAVVVLAGGALALVKPAVWSVAFALSTWQRAGVLAYWAALLGLALPAMQGLAASRRVSNIIVRKGYHGLAVALFLPVAAREPQLLGVSLAIAFALLAAVELVRAADLPFIGRKVHDFMTTFIDSRDSGALLVTHFTLLLGMAAPLWLSDAVQPAPSCAGQAASNSSAGAGGGGGGMHAGAGVPAWPAGVAGIMVLGFGDTAASVVGRLLGRHPICHGGKKTWEGTAGGLVATLMGWWLFSPLAGASASAGSGGGDTLFDQSATVGLVSWPALAGATALSCLLEAVTTQLDNLFVPLHYFTLLCCGIAVGRGSQ